MRFHKWASEQKKTEGEEESADKKEEKKGPRSTDWRWGPAQYWYVHSNNRTFDWRRCETNRLLVHRVTGGTGYLSVNHYSGFYPF